MQEGEILLWKVCLSGEVSRKVGFWKLTRNRTALKIKSAESE